MPTSPESLYAPVTDYVSVRAGVHSKSRISSAPAYRPDIDGLRAIAILAVLGFHAFPWKFPGGFVGVDIFFVISGYLISSIILGALECNRFSLADFYGKRIRRIVPALLVVMVFCLVAGWYVLLGDEFRQLGKHIVGGSAFVQNFVLWGESGYFDNDPDSKPLLHLWSLAVEEQFYIFWPLLLIAAHKWRWPFLVFTVTIAVISFGIDLYLTWNAPTAAFYSPLSRFWELMSGCLLAWFSLKYPDQPARYADLRALGGLALTVAAFLLIDRDRHFPGCWALLPTGGALLVLSAGQRAWLNRTVLSSRPFVWVGLISYPLYLWHWPLLSFASITFPGHGRLGTILLLSMAVVLAAFTYYGIERKVRTGRVNGQFGFALCGGLAIVALTGLVVDQAALAPRNTTFHGMSAWNEWGFLDPQIGEKKIDAGIYVLHPERKETTLFVGDSHVAQYAERVDRAQDTDSAKNGAIFAVGGSCPPIPQVYDDDPYHKNCWSVREEAFARAQSPRVTSIVVGGYWSEYFGSHDFYVRRGNVRLAMDTPEGSVAALASLERVIKNLQANHKTVYLLLDNPVGDAFNPHVYIDRFSAMHPARPSRFVKVSGNQVRVRMAMLALARRTGASVIDPQSRLCTGENCIRVTADSIPVYLESSHLSPEWIRSNAGYIDVAL